MVERRAGGLPLEQVIGWAEFCGLRIAVDPGVFVPRLRTEFLVRQAVLLLRDPPGAPARPGAIVVDLCCGTGAIGAAIAAAVDGAEVHAADIDPAAVRCARRNVPGAVYQGDLYAPLPARLRGQVAVLAANVPYVPTAEIGFLPPEARAHEPLAALDGGPDGLDLLRRVAAGAARVASARRSPADRDQRPPGPAGRSGLRGRRPRPASGQQRGLGRHRPDRDARRPSRLRCVCHKPIGHGVCPQMGCVCPRPRLSGHMCHVPQVSGRHRTGYVPPALSIEVRCRNPERPGLPHRACGPQAPPPGPGVPIRHPGLRVQPRIPDGSSRSWIATARGRAVAIHDPALPGSPLLDRSPRGAGLVQAATLVTGMIHCTGPKRVLAVREPAGFAAAPGEQAAG